MSVYFIKVGRYIKVGYSENPERRCERLWSSTTRYGRPWDMSTKEPRELLLVIEGEKDDERECHEALADYYSACEWFIDEPGVREFMEIAKTGKYPKMVRPGGEFIPTPGEDMLPERRLEIDRMVARERAKWAAA